MTLRPYQQHALDLLYDWLANNPGHPVINLPTGSGKSIVIAELCRQAVQQWPETRILMLTRSLELIEQNAAKLRAIWPGAPMGIYSASIGRKELDEPITIGGPLSIVNALDRMKHIDLCLVDECHDISHRDEGSYREIIKHLMSLNPAMRVIGFTASPFRMGHGLITDKPAIFDAIIEPTSILELIEQGFLSVMRSKTTALTYDLKGVKKRGGDYVEADLQRVIDTDDNNAQMVREVIERAGDRKSWMFFCSGVAHAEHVSELLNQHGVSAVPVTSMMRKEERATAIAAFRSGAIQAVTNVNCLSTGFDHPEIDLLVLARPTMSPGLYLQQVGRGLRVAPGKRDCLVLDFAGNVAQHGPITAVQPPRSAGSGDGDAPVKVCDACAELCHISAKECPACGHPFPPAKKEPLTLRSDDILGLEGLVLEVGSWRWRKHVSRTSGLAMLAATYYGQALSDPSITEYFPVLHEGYAGQKALAAVASIANASQADGGLFSHQTLEEIAYGLSQATAPSRIEYKRDGKFHRVIQRSWARVEAAA